MLTNIFANTYSYDTSSGSNGGSALVIVFLLLCLAIGITMLVSMWRMFTKAGKPGWAILVPIYNAIVLLEIVGRPLWWIFLFLIPGVNVVVNVIVYYDLAKSFGKGVETLLMFMFLPFIGFPLIGFGESRYLGPAGAQGGAGAAPHNPSGPASAAGAGPSGPAAGPTSGTPSTPATPPSPIS